MTVKLSIYTRQELVILCIQGTVKRGMTVKLYIYTRQNHGIQVKFKFSEKEINCYHQFIKTIS